MKIGYDLYCIEESHILSLLNYVKKNKLRLYHLKKENGIYTFYTSSLHSFYWKRSGLKLQYLETIGIIKYILLLKRFYSLIVFVGFIIGITLCTRLIFKVEIKGTLLNVNQDMYGYLSEQNVSLYCLKKSYEDLNDLLMQIKEKYKNNIEYVNLYQQGGVFFVEYTNKKRVNNQILDYKNLYASKDGMIESFDIESGNILVKRLDYVKKGELLVENTLVSTDNTIKIIPVKGKVYAYTFNQFEASIDDKGQDYIEAFYHLLLLIRSQLPADVVVDKENVLQMDRSSSKITLKMHYTLLEDIAMKKEN